jgi:hypothetical protein
MQIFALIPDNIATRPGNLDPYKNKTLYTYLIMKGLRDDSSHSFLIDVFEWDNQEPKNYAGLLLSQFKHISPHERPENFALGAFNIKGEKHIICIEAKEFLKKFICFEENKNATPRT